MSDLPVGAPPSSDAEELADAMTRLKDGAVILGPDLTIRWVNQAMADLLGYPSPKPMIGSSIVDHLHPDELEFAFHAVAIAGQEPERQVPGQYRLRHRDGRWVAAELSGGVMPAPRLGGDVTVVTVRPTAHRDVLTNGYVDLTRGRPLDEVLRDAIEWYHERTQRYRVALAYVDVHDEFGDRWSYTGDDLPDALRGLPPENRDAGSPWGRVLAGEEFVVADIHDLPHHVGQAAREAGLRSVMVLRIADPSGRPALMSFWIETDPSFFPKGYTVKTPALVLIELALERRHYLARLEQAATTDPLTRLANRRVFFDLLDIPSPNGGRKVDVDHGGCAVLYIDLDGFKAVNDEFGHDAGDRMLIAMADRLRANIRPGDLLARLGGDEFAVLCPGLSNPEEAAGVAARLLGALMAPLGLPDLELQPSASIGIAIGTSAVEARRDLVALADRAMYEAKRAGKGRSMLLGSA